MENIEIKLTFIPSRKELYKLNMPFQELIEQKREEQDHLFVSRISSYHDPMSNEPEWFVYNKLEGVQIIIAGSDKTLSTNDMFGFMGANNGFSFSRDNLFMLWEIYRNEISKYILAEKKNFSLVAIAPLELLPVHANGPKICPMLEIDYSVSGNINLTAPNYDWTWINDNRMEIKTFAFFRKRVSSPLTEYYL